MSVALAKSSVYGPGRVDLQIEQGSDLVVGFVLAKTTGTTTVPWDLTSATFDAHMSIAWSPGAVPITLPVTAVDLPNGKIQILLPAASSLTVPFVSLPAPPRKSVAPTPFALGGWVLNVIDGGVNMRVLEGTVYLDRDPCQA